MPQCPDPYNPGQQIDCPPTEKTFQNIGSCFLIPSDQHFTVPPGGGSPSVPHTFYVEGIAAGQVDITFTVSGDNSLSANDKVRLTVVETDIDIARLGGAGYPGPTVAESTEHKQGSITKVLNPNVGIYPEDTIEPEVGDGTAPNLQWGLHLTHFSLQPIDMIDEFTFKLRKRPIAGSPKIRLFRKTGTEPDNYEVLFDGTDDGEEEVAFESDWFDDEVIFDFIAGGLVEIELVALFNGFELHVDRVRASGIACPPKDGRIIYVNPSSSDPSDPQTDPIPFDDYDTTAAHTIEDALVVAAANENVLIDPHLGNYEEQGLVVSNSICLAGLSLNWLQNLGIDYEDHPDIVNLGSRICLNAQDHGPEWIIPN